AKPCRAGLGYSPGRLRTVRDGRGSPEELCLEAARSFEIRAREWAAPSLSVCVPCICGVGARAWHPGVRESYRPPAISAPSIGSACDAGAAGKVTVTVVPLPS